LAQVLRTLSSVCPTWHPRLQRIEILALLHFSSLSFSPWVPGAQADHWRSCYWSVSTGSRRPWLPCIGHGLLRPPQRRDAGFRRPPLCAPKPPSSSRPLATTRMSSSVSSRRRQCWALPRWARLPLAPRLALRFRLRMSRRPLCWARGLPRRSHLLLAPLHAQRLHLWLSRRLAPLQALRLRLQMWRRPPCWARGRPLRSRQCLAILKISASPTRIWAQLSVRGWSRFQRVRRALTRKPPRLRGWTEPSNWDSGLCLACQAKMRILSGSKSS